MPTYTLSDDDAHWLAVALENSKASAERTLLDEEEDLLDRVDAGLLVHRYTRLQAIFPPPEVSLDKG